MRTVLVSNIPHYHHLAEALHGAGFLTRYITAPALLEGEQAARWLPGTLRKKLEGRRLNGVPESLVRQVRWPEYLQRAMPLTGLMSRERADWLNNNLFDRRALGLVPECDVLHFVSSVGLHCARAAKAAGATVICDVRQEHPEFQRQMLEEESARFGMTVRITGSTYEPRVLEELELADYIVTPSTHARRTFLERGFAAEKLLLLPYGVDLGQFRNEGKKDAMFRVIYAGALTVRKGPQYLLEAFSKLGGAAELILVGPVDPAFQPVLARYEGQFRYLGMVPKTTLKELYSASSVFVLPSLADSFSLATLEAMACGVPVIVSRNTGAADVLEDGGEGFVVPIRDAEAIREKLELLRRDEAMRREMGMRAEAKAREMTWSRYGREAVRHYQEIQRKAARQLDAVAT